MICPPCKKAGDINANANREDDPKIAARMRKRAASWHKKCKGYPNDASQCTCQHRTGDVTVRSLS